jgi:hypothetical protein
MIRSEAITESRLQEYLLLFKESFPHQKFSAEYLKWLYFDNPQGVVQGFDAIKDGKIVSHYACIPTRINNRNGVLSLNSVTSKEFRGLGLFSRLSGETFDKVSEKYEFVIGVANSNSADVFIHNLGFKCLGEMNLRFGDLLRSFDASKNWSETDLNWLSKNPRRNIIVKEIKPRIYSVSSKFHRYGPKLRSIILTSPVEESLQLLNLKTYRALTVDWRRDEKSKCQLPSTLKPSPLRIVLKQFQGLDLKIESFSLFDFDLI